MTLDELDRLAAEKVMGWRRELFWPVSDLREDTSKPCEIWYPPGCTVSQTQPTPTRNIIQAWECLEKVNLPFDIAGTGFGHKHFYCSVFIREEKFEARATSAPEAIIRACLKAKQVPGV